MPRIRSLATLLQQWTQAKRVPLPFFASGRLTQPDRLILARLKEVLHLTRSCPICTLLTERDLTGLEAILWEQVTDPLTHRSLLAARGFCFLHSWALIPAGNHVRQHYGVAILLARLLREFLSAVQQSGLWAAREWLTPEQPCPACSWEQHREAALLRAFAWLTHEESEAFRRVSVLLCRPHYAALLTWHRLTHTPLTSRQEAVLERLRDHWQQHLATGTLSQRVALLFGREPPYLPAAATYCPTCAVARSAGPRSPVLQWDRATAWLCFHDNPARLSEILANLQPSPELLTQAAPEGRTQRTPSPGGSDERKPSNELAPSDPPGCLGHLKAALSGMRDQMSWAPEALLQTTTRRYVTTLQHAERYIASADYRFRGTLTEEERRSWRDLIALFAGEVPGISLHPGLNRDFGC